jgi:hypothetical protein
MKIKYNIIPKERSQEWNVLPELWERHPDCHFFCRTNVRYSRNDKVWVGGVGITKEQAIENAIFAVQHDSVDTTSYRPAGLLHWLDGQTPIYDYDLPEVEAEETNEIIKNT